MSISKLNNNDFKMLLEILKGTEGAGKISRNIGIAPVNIWKKTQKFEKLGLITISNKKNQRGFKRKYHLESKGKRIIKLIKLIEKELE